MRFITHAEEMDGRTSSVVTIEEEVKNEIRLQFLSNYLFDTYLTNLNVTDENTNFEYTLAKRDYLSITERQTLLDIEENLSDEKWTILYEAGENVLNSLLLWGWTAKDISEVL